MKKVITFGFPCAILLAFLFVESTVSCKKPTDCTAVVTVLDSTTHAAVPGADVKLYANITPPGQIQGEGRTDGSGSIKFVFQLPAIFDVLATTPTQKGTGIIQLQIGQTVTYTVYVAP